MLITVDADIDDNGPFLDPVSADQLWTADGSDDDIRLSAYLRDPRRM